MREHSRFRRDGQKTDGDKPLFPVVIIPLVVIILIIVIMVADRGGKGSEAANAEAQQAPQNEAVQQDGADPAGSDDGENDGSGEQADLNGSVDDADGADDADANGADSSDADGGDGASHMSETMAANLQKDGVPELLSLMQTYFQARAAGDAETMNQLYGISGLSVSALEAEKTRMRSNSKYVRSFENIITYVKEGVEPGAWLVYTTCDIQFHSVETAVPMIMWCYVTTDAEGNYLILRPEDLSVEMQRHVDEMNRTEEVRSLASDVNTRLKEALLNDADLNEVYGVLRDGSPVYQQEDETDAVQILEPETDDGAETEIIGGAHSGIEVEISGGAEPEAGEGADFGEDAGADVSETVETGTETGSDS